MAGFGILAFRMLLYKRRRLAESCHDVFGKERERQTERERGRDSFRQSGRTSSSQGERETETDRGHVHFVSKSSKFAKLLRFF